MKLDSMDRFIYNIPGVVKEIKLDAASTQLVIPKVPAYTTTLGRRSARCPCPAWALTLQTHMEASLLCVPVPVPCEVCKTAAEQELPLPEPNEDAGVFRCALCLICLHTRCNSAARSALGLPPLEEMPDAGFECGFCVFVQAAS